MTLVCWARVAYRQHFRQWIEWKHTQTIKIIILSNICGERVNHLNIDIVLNLFLSATLVRTVWSERAKMCSQKKTHYSIELNCHEKCAATSWVSAARESRVPRKTLIHTLSAAPMTSTLLVHSSDIMWMCCSVREWILQMCNLHKTEKAINIGLQLSRRNFLLKRWCAMIMFVDSVRNSEKPIRKSHLHTFSLLFSLALFILSSLRSLSFFSFGSRENAQFVLRLSKILLSRLCMYVCTREKYNKKALKKKKIVSSVLCVLWTFILFNKNLADHILLKRKRDRTCLKIYLLNFFWLESNFITCYKHT